MNEPINLESLAADAAAQLQEVWNLIGVADAERSEFLADLSAKVAALYENAVASQQERQTGLEAEIEQLQQTVVGLQEAMDRTADGLPAGDHLSLTAFRDLLEETRSDVQKAWDAREAELAALHEQLVAACAEIAEPLSADFADGIGARMTQARADAYADELAAVAEVKAARAAEIEELCKEVAVLWADIESAPPAEDALASAAVSGGLDAVTAAFGWGASVIADLQGRLTALQQDVDSREARITELGTQLTHYWHRLNTPEEEQRAFLEQHAGISDAIFEVVEAAIARMRDEFTSRLTELVAKARTAISAAWDEMRAGPQQRAEMFPAFMVEGPMTEALFVEHEGYLTHVRASLEDMKPIIRGLEKREELLRDKVEYTAIIADASRLLARGSSAARLREEKLERRVKRELPALLKKLREQVKEWEAGTGRAFLVQDVRFVEQLDDEDAKEAREKGEARAARHGGSSAPAAAAAPAAGAGSGATLASSAVFDGSASGRATSAGRMSVYRGGAAAGASTASVAATGASRKPSVTSAQPATAAAAAAAAGDASTADENGAGAATTAPIVAKRTGSAAVAAPSVPLRDGSAVNTAGAGAVGAKAGGRATSKVRGSAVPSGTL